MLRLAPNRNSRSRTILLSIFVLGLFLLLTIADRSLFSSTGMADEATSPSKLLPTHTAQQAWPAAARQEITDTWTIWLPFLPVGRASRAEKPIWAEGDAQAGTVALFRADLAIPGGFDQAELSIMADTRFEVWLDGQWLGRGPARFSRVRQEFDTFSLGELGAGQHLLAVLVQYAPNARRSESLQAALQASLSGWDGTTWQTVVATNAGWKAIVAPAWDSQAMLVSQLDLIGPMELLDLGQLPQEWIQPAFDDASWPYAQEITPSPFPAPAARTLPPLDNVPRAPVGVVEHGLLSPGRQIVEFQVPQGSDPPVVHTLVVTAMTPTTLSVEAIETTPISVDGELALTWKPLDDPRRPDVVLAQQALDPGAHVLDVTIPAERPCALQKIYAPLSPYEARSETSIDTGGLTVSAAGCTRSAGRTLAIDLSGLELAGDAGVTPTHDPGRRTLLADPVPGGATAPEVEILADRAQVYIPPGDTPRYVVLDFGRTLHARLSLEADGPKGTILDAGWDERLTAGRPLPNPGSLVSNLWSQVDSWVLDGTPRKLTTLDTRSGRYLLLQVFGPGPVHLWHIQAIEETYPVTPTGSFSSSDPLLDTIWQVGVDTLVPNMTDAYTDTPWRERGQWWGDAMIAFHVNRAAFGDLALLRRGLRQMADAIDVEGRPTGLAPNGQGTMLLDSGMQWVEGLTLYWTLSDDLDLVQELYPAAQRLIGFLATYEGPAGLLDVPPAHWSQSALVDWPAASSRSGESTALNAQYASTLEQMGHMAQALGNAELAQEYSEQSEAVRQAIHEALFVPDQGCYAASRLDGELIAPSPHAQAWALRHGVVPDGHTTSTAQALVRQLSPFFDENGWSAVEPLGMYVTLEALGSAGRTVNALDLIRERYGSLLDQGATTWWELFTPLQDRGQSLSHAWGGSPTWFLSSHVLGGIVRGPAVWRIAPHPGDLAHAQGAVPLGADVLEISWEHPDCSQFLLDVTAPEGTSGDILLPITRYDAQVILDGITVWDNGPLDDYPAEMTDQGILLGELGGGEHQVSASLACHALFLPLVSH